MQSSQGKTQVWVQISAHSVDAPKTSAAVQQGLPETFLTKTNHSALADCPWGVAAGGDGSKGGGGGLGPPALLRVGLLPVR